MKSTHRPFQISATKCFNADKSRYEWILSFQVTRKAFTRSGARVIWSSLPSFTSRERFETCQLELKGISMMQQDEISNAGGQPWRII